MVLTSVKTSNWRLERKVKLNSLNSPSITPILLLERLVKPPALWQVKFPLIVLGPSREIVLAAVPITMLPETVAQLASASASA